MPDQVRFRLCPVCARAVPSASEERFCINDGARMLEECPRCHAGIHSPYTRHCSNCGLDFHAASSYTPADADPPRDRVGPRLEAPDSTRDSRRSVTPGTTRTLSRRGFLIALGGTALVATVGAVALLTTYREPLRGVYLGRIPNSRAFIAIATRDGRALAYVCDGEGIAEWFRGRVTDAHDLTLQSRTGATLNASLDATTASGALRLPIGDYAFAALSVPDGAGLYRAEGRNLEVGGWIVLPTGEERAVITTAAGVRAAPKLELARSPLETTRLGLESIRAVNPRDPNGYEF